RPSAWLCAGEGARPHPVGLRSGCAGHALCRDGPASYRSRLRIEAVAVRPVRGQADVIAVVERVPDRAVTIRDDRRIAARLELRMTANGNVDMVAVRAFGDVLIVNGST